MNWVCRISRNAADQLSHLPKDRQRQLSQAIDEMKEDPLRGDVRPIKSGKYRGSLRKRVGNYRIIFSVNHSANLIEIATVLIKSEKTYR